MTEETKELLNHIWTDRLIIKFKGVDIGADIAKGTSLPDALRAVADVEEARLIRVDRG